MASMEHPEAVQSFMLVDGQAYVSLPAPPALPPSLSMGAALASLEPCDPTLPYRYSQQSKWPLKTNKLLADLSSEPAESAAGQFYAAWINKLSDWALMGSETLQIMVRDRARQVSISCNRPIEAHDASNTRTFQAKIACHRAKATLQVHFTDPQRKITETRQIAFDSNFIGGVTAAGYQLVRIPVPPKISGAVEVTFSALYEGYRDDGSGGEPFLFLADIALLSEDHPRQEGALEPLMLPTAPGSNGGAYWFSVPLPDVAAPGAPVSVSAGAIKETLTLPPRPNFEVMENHGHTIVIEAMEAIQMALYVDGDFDRLLSLPPGHTGIRLSNHHFDGATHRISLRDASGTVAFWDLHCVVPAISTPTDILQRETPAPFPDTVFPQMPQRYRSLKALLEAGDPQADFAQLHHALLTLEGGHEKVELRPLSFPEVPKPDVSIVIPAHNKVDVTYLALCSLLLAPNKASFEVIVVDDASTDETAELENLVKGITVLHNAEPQRFIRACNAGVAQARGTYVMLLNNDVEVTAGFLDALIDGMARFPRAGLVGSKLLYPNGRLQDAGGIIWSSGDPWNYGNGQNPNDPRFAYARQVDYLTGAAMLTTKKIWDEVGGLSAYLEPMYFEDTDFSFKVREAGYTTWFIPSSIVYHYEGITSGTDTNGSGFKRFQEINRPKFKRRWAGTYAKLGTDSRNADLEKDRGIVGRVLFIDYATPRPDEDAGSYAAVQEIRLVQALGYKVTFLPANIAHLGSHTSDLQDMGVEMIYAPYYLNLQEYLEAHAAEFDAVYITRFHVANEVLETLKAHAPRARILFNNADLHFLRELRAARISGNQEDLETARETREAELKVIEKVDVVLSYNGAEHAVIEAYTEGRAKTALTPWVVDIPDKVPPLSKRAGLSFLGSFRHLPNAEGVTWFANQVMPLLAQRDSKGQKPQVLSIYGSRMGPDIEALASDTIKPVGFVKDVADAYGRHRIFVAPLLSGAGIKGKVLAAMAHGIPCVLSPIAAEGIGLRSGQDCFVARTPEEWVSAILKLNEDPALWNKISEAARQYMSDNYSFERGKEAMRDAFEMADLYLHGAHL